MAKRNDIKLGTHGEDYGNWMSTPVFYVFGGLAALALILAVVSFALLHIAGLGLLIPPQKFLVPVSALERYCSEILKCYPESNKPAVS